MVSNRYQMLTRFAKNNRVFLFERPIMITIDKHRLYEVVHPIRYEKNLIIISPVYSIYKKMMQDNYRFHLKKLYQHFDLTAPIFWFYNFNLWYLIDEFPNSLSAYHCTEFYSQISRFSSGDKKVQEIEENEAKLVKKVDLVFAVSEFLVKKQQKINPRTYAAINAVDYNLYSLAQKKPRRQFGRKPVLGYVGNLSPKINFALLYQLAIVLKDCQLVLAGPISANDPYVSKLRNLGNVLFLDAQPVEKLPDLIREFDVCLIPYIQNDWFSKASQPLKLYEYLSSGKPIVSTRMDCLKKVNDLVYSSSTISEFILQTKRAIKENNPKIRQKRIEAAKANTWDKRFEMMNFKMEKILAKRRNEES